jgi:hypothetical protein
MPDRRSLELRPLLALTAIALIVFGPVLFGGRTLYPTDVTNNLILPFAADRSVVNVQETSISDYVLYYYPVRYFQAASFRSGHLNLWNPYIFSGQPAFANNASIVAFDPFNLILLWPNLASALAWRSFLQVVACLALMYLYLRHLQLSVAGSLIGALGYGFNSMFWVNVFDWSIGGMLWLPLVCLLVDRCLIRPSVRRVALTGLVFGIALLSSPLQIYFYLCFCVAALLALQWIVLRRDGESLKRTAVVGAAVFAIGIALTAVQLIPSFELYSQSSRFAAGPLHATGKTMRSPRETAVATVALASFVFPNLAGRLKNSMMVSGALWGGEAHWQGFIGIVPWFLAVLAAWAGVDRRRIPYTILGLSVPIIVLYTPLGPVLYERFFLLYIFSTCVLAAFGCTAACSAELVDRRARPAVRVIASFLGAIVIALIVVNIALAVAGPRIAASVDAAVSATLATNYLGQSYPALYLQKGRQFLDDLRWNSPHTFAPVFVAFLGLAAISLRTRGQLGARAFASIALGLTAADLVFMTMTHVPYVDVARNPFTPPSQAIERVRGGTGPYRVISYRSPSRAPVLPLGLVSTYGIEAADGNDDLGPPNLFRLISFAHRPCGAELCVEPQNTDLANVRYILGGPDVRLPEDRFNLVYDREVRIYQDRNTIGRAFWVDSYEVVRDTEAAIVRARSHTFDPRSSVVLDGTPSFIRQASTASAKVEVLEHTPQRVTVRVDAASPGLLVLSDTYYPGWRAEVDGTAAHIFRANGVMRAVAVAPGSHTVRFTYAPRSFKLGAAISLLSLTGALAAALLPGTEAAS